MRQIRITVLMWVVGMFFTACTKDKSEEIQTGNPPKDTVVVPASDNIIYFPVIGEVLFDHATILGSDIGTDGSLVFHGYQDQFGFKNHFLVSVNAAGVPQCDYSVPDSGLAKPVIHKGNQRISYFNNADGFSLIQADLTGCKIKANKEVYYYGMSKQATLINEPWLSKNSTATYLAFNFRNGDTVAVNYIPINDAYGAYQGLQFRNATLNGLWMLDKNIQGLYMSLNGKDWLYRLNDTFIGDSIKISIPYPWSSFQSLDAEGEPTGFFTYQYENKSALKIVHINGDGQMDLDKEISIQSELYFAIGPDLNGGFYVAVDGETSDHQPGDHNNCKLVHYNSQGDFLKEQGYFVLNLGQYWPKMIRQIPTTKDIVVTGVHYATLEIGKGQNKTKKSSEFLFKQTFQPE